MKRSLVKGKTPCRAAALLFQDQPHNVGSPANGWKGFGPACVLVFQHESAERAGRGEGVSCKHGGDTPWNCADFCFSSE